MKFHVTKRHLFFGTDDRWLQIDTRTMELRYYDADPGDEAEPAIAPKRRYALSQIEAVEYEATVAAKLAMPIPPAGQPEVSLRFANQGGDKVKPLRFSMEDFSLLDTFTQVLYGLLPEVQLFVSGKQVQLRRTSAKGKLKARSIIDTSASAKSAPKMPLSTAPSRAGSKIHMVPPPRAGSKFNATMFPAARTPASVAKRMSTMPAGSAVPKYLLEKQEEEAAAAARELMHSKWNAALTTPKSQRQSATSNLTLALASKRSADSSPGTPSSTNSTLNFPVSPNSRYSRLLQPFAKSITSKILLLKQVGGAAPLHLRFMLLNQLLQLIVTETREGSTSTDSIDSTQSRSHADAYALIPEMEALVRAEYQRGKDLRWKEYERKLLAQGLTIHPTGVEATSLEASEPELAAALKQVLEALFDLLALTIGDVQLTSAITERLALCNGDEASFLSELKTMSRQLLEQQAGVVFPITRRGEANTGSVIKISSKVVGMGSNFSTANHTPMSTAQSSQRSSNAELLPLPSFALPDDDAEDENQEDPDSDDEAPPPPPPKRDSDVAPPPPPPPQRAAVPPPPPPERRNSNDFVPPPPQRRDSNGSVPPPPPPKPQADASIPPPPPAAPAASRPAVADDSDDDDLPPPPPPVAMQVETDADFLPVWDRTRSDSLARARASTVSRKSSSAVSSTSATPCGVRGFAPIMEEDHLSSEFPSSASSPPNGSHLQQHRGRAVVVAQR